jgi:hypothetical protein
MCLIDVKDEEPSEKEIQEMIKKDCVIYYLVATFDEWEITKMLYEKLTEKEKEAIMLEVEEDARQERECR